jgi:hypothetical protein
MGDDHETALNDPPFAGQDAGGSPQILRFAGARRRDGGRFMDALQALSRPAFLPSAYDAFPA